MQKNFTQGLLRSLVLVMLTAFAGKTQINACGVGAPVLTVNTTCVTTAYSVPSSFTADAPAAASCITAANNREDGWYQFVATSTNTIITVTSNRDVVIAVYSGSCAGTEVACTDAVGSGVTETVSFSTVIGTTYFIRVIRYDSGANNNMAGDICVFSPPIPGNNECATATNLTVSATCSSVSGTNLGATASAGVGTPSCSTYGNNDVWYRFTAPSANLEITTTAGSMNDAAMSLYSGTCGSLTEIECDNDDGTGNMPYITRCDFVAGTTYYIRVWGDGGVSGTFNICVNNTGAAPSNTTTNCSGGTTVCSDASFSGNSSGAGATELSGTVDGCLSGEHQSSWYFFQAQTAGTIQLNITPANGTDDYDFAIWGPFTSGVACPPCAAPLRCSYAAGGGTTGLQSGAGDDTEGAGGNRFVNAITATAGSQYVLMVDNFSTSSSPFTLDWTLSGGATLGCLVLPIELTAFTGVNEGTRNRLNWTTASETDNNFFILEKSVDGFNFSTLAQVPGAGTSTSPLHYHAYDENPSPITYYRLKQTDFDGHSVYSNVVVVKASVEIGLPIEVFPVPTSDLINILFTEDIPENTQVYITDLTGRILHTETVNDNGRMLTIDLSGINTGIYLLMAENKELNKKSTLRKIVVE